ncbi:class I SAM-dependent methyltransferase [Streptomyces sp. NPDC127084]|uniref:class I SAM-dependent methyltransferase n=1 Tax=Streptomyces sp. NPDC127084 TaxID=3347133 RepID=UPI0036636D38
MTADAAKDWISVFKQRQIWELTQNRIEEWIERNSEFFSLLSDVLPGEARVLELGCGPGRHAIAQALCGYLVTAIDIDPTILEQARKNAMNCAPDSHIEFLIQDMNCLDGFAEDLKLDAVTHGGLMEHFPSPDAIRTSLHRQLAVAPYVIFDVPFDTRKNRALFDKDTIFRQIWTSEKWTSEILSGFGVIEWRTEIHEEASMTDDLIVCIRR